MTERTYTASSAPYPTITTSTSTMNPRLTDFSAPFSDPAICLMTLLAPAAQKSVFLAMYVGSRQTNKLAIKRDKEGRGGDEEKNRHVPKEDNANGRGHVAEQNRRNECSLPPGFRRAYRHFSFSRRDWVELWALSLVAPGIRFFRSLLGTLPPSRRSLSLVGDREKRLLRLRSWTGVAAGETLRTDWSGAGAGLARLRSTGWSPKPTGAKTEGSSAGGAGFATTNSAVGVAVVVSTAGTL